VVQLGVAGGASATTFEANAGSLGAIPDGPGSAGTFGPAKDVTFTVPNDTFASGSPTGVAVTLSSDHTWVGDLDVTLIAPNGEDATVFSRTGASGGNVNGHNANLAGPYTFTDLAPAAPTWWEAAGGTSDSRAIPEGSYRASAAGPGSGPNASLIGALTNVPNMNGTWTLRVRDGTGGDTGSITSASLKLTGSVPAIPGFLGPIPDGSESLDVFFQVSGLTQVAPSSIQTSMTFSPNHTYVGDLEVTLIAPDDTEATIFSRTGDGTGGNPGYNANLAGAYSFFDGALGNWWTTAAGTADGSPITAGNYKASSSGGAGSTGAAISLDSAFSGVTDPNGAWRLRFHDRSDDLDTGGVGAATLRILSGIDSVAPLAPSLGVVTNPPSPSSSSLPKIQGNTDPGSTVRLYSNGTCGGLPAATGPAAQLTGAEGIPIPIDSDGPTSISATTYDAGGNVSACSNAISYTRDTVAPPTPTLSTTDPPSPANNHLPKFKGSAEADSTVRFYDSADCTGPAAATRPASDLNGAGAEIEVPENETTTVRATATDAAGNASGCSAPISYTEDSISALPTGLTTDPASPANNNSPKLKGTGADADAVIVGYLGTICTGPGDFNGTAAELHGAGIPFSATGDGTTTFVIESFDLAGNGSGCSAPVTYVEDSTAPAAPSLSGTDPGATANQNSPKVKGSAEAGAQVRLFASTDCSGAPIGTGSAGDLAGAGLTAAVPDDATTQIRATATDAAGNASGCSASIAYTEDSKGPQTSATTAKKKVTAKKKTARVKFALSSPEPGASFECRIDRASFAPCGAAVKFKLKKGKHTLEAVAIDAAGNRDPSPAKASVKVKPKRR
jgi:subtilisin-like proprotein convertase family protein